jgi:hypothetical protein
MPKRVLLAALTLATGWLPANAAAAHTAATCDWSGYEARCAGTITDRTLSPAPSPASLTVSGTTAVLWLDLHPLVSVFSPDIQVTGQLSCDRVANGLLCNGRGEADCEPITINTAGSADRSSAAVTIADGSANRAQTLCPPSGLPFGQHPSAAAPRAGRGGSPHRRSPKRAGRRRSACGHHPAKHHRRRNRCSHCSPAHGSPSS